MGRPDARTNTKDESDEEQNEMQPIRKPYLYEGCKIRALPRPRHPVMKLAPKPPWDSSQSKPKVFTMRHRPQGKGRQCHQESEASQVPGYRIVNGWQVAAVGDTCVKTSESMTSSDRDDKACTSNTSSGNSSRHGQLSRIRCHRSGKICHE